MDKLKTAIENNCIEWRKHVVKRMIERNISRETVIEVLKSGEKIEDYPDDKPYPSALFLGWFKGKPYHVVAAFDSMKEWGVVITVYRPNLKYFKSNYKERENHDK